MAIGEDCDTKGIDVESDQSVHPCRAVEHRSDASRLGPRASAIGRAGDGAAVTVGPNDLKLTFSEALEAKLSGAAVAAEGKGEISTDTPVLAEGNDRVLIIPLQERLGAGKYTVNWHALSKDGHTTHSSYSFVVRP